MMADRARAGLTLLEVLAVLTLGSLVAATVGRGALRPSPRCGVERAVEQLRDVDSRARALAVRGGGAELVVEGREWILRDAEGHEAVARSIPGDVEVQIVPPFVRWDAAGRSASYRAHITDRGYRDEVGVHGLSGWMTRDRE